VAEAFLKILTEPQERQIDAAAMQILSEVGLDVASDEVRAILTVAGCHCQDRRVRFPVPLVRESVESAPKSFEIHAPDPDRTVCIGDGRSHIQPMIGRLNFLEANGTRHRTSLADLRRIVTVCDTLEHYDVLHGGAVMPEIADVPAGLAHVAGFVETLRHTRKAFKGSCRGREVAEDCHRLAEAVSDVLDRPLTLHTTCNVVSPIQMPSDMTEGALVYLRKGWPVDFASEPQLGATSPVTLAGTLAQGLAETLGGVALAQAVNPGCPVFVGTVAAAMDMRHATIALGGVEAALINACHAQMASYYGLPSRGTGANTNAKQLDFQAGYEKMLTLVLPLLAGIDLLFYPGTLEHAETISLESLVLDHDLCAIALRCCEGLRTSEDLLAVDLLKQVGPGGTFLGLPQTAREMFTETLVRGLWDRTRRSDWEAAGSPTPLHAARARVDEILSQARDPLPDAVDRALADVVSDIAGQRGALQIIEQLWPE
jgi:trimethylamine--corrinoid protein Co-methyltransferase